MKVFRLFRLKRILLVFKVWTQYVHVQHLIYWQGQRVCDALFATTCSYVVCVFCLSVCLQFALCVQNAFHSAHSHALNTTI
jgi:hypothetical protein